MRRFWSDTIPPILGFLGALIFEVTILRLNLHQLIISRAINGTSDLIGGWPYGLWRDWVINLVIRKNWRFSQINPLLNLMKGIGWKIPELKGKQLGNTLAFACFQAPLYSLALLIAGAIWWKILMGFCIYLLIAPIGGPLYGKILETSRKTFNTNHETTTP